MIIRNIGPKIINIGTTVLMPDSCMKVSKDIVSTPAIQVFIRKGFIRVEADDSEKTTKDAAKKKAAEEAAMKTSDEAATKKAAQEK